MMSKINYRVGGGTSVVSSILLLIIPKCPVCLAAYSTIIASLGISSSMLNGVHYALSIVLAISTVWLIYTAINSKNYFQSSALLTGATLVISSWIIDAGSTIKITSVVILMICIFWVIATQYQKSKSHQLESCKHCSGNRESL